MKSTKQQLEERGFVPEEDLIAFKNISSDEIFRLLQSYKASDRTLGAKLSTGIQNKKLLPLLCQLLQNEKKLYTKIALSESIEKYGELSLKYLIPLLGQIGNNQHRKAALIDINKKSYPLPRDTAARIIIRIGESALPFLEEIIISGTYFQKLEALDAVGHITFNSNNYRSEKLLHALLEENYNDDLIIWKIIRAFQSFLSREVENQLKNIIEHNDSKVLKSEAERSLRQIKKRKYQN